MFQDCSSLLQKGKPFPQAPRWFLPVFHWPEQGSKAPHLQGKLAESFPAFVVVVKREQVGMLWGRPADRCTTPAPRDVGMSLVIERYAQSLTQSLNLIIINYYSPRTYSPSLGTD